MVVRLISSSAVLQLSNEIGRFDFEFVDPPFDHVSINVISSYPWKSLEGNVEEKKKGERERKKNVKPRRRTRSMIVSSDLIARDPRVSSRFNFSEKKTHSPRSFAALAFGLCDRQRAAFTTGGEGSGSALVLGFDSRRRPWLTDPFNRGTFASLGKQTSSGQRLERCRNRAILRQPPLFLLRSSTRKRNRHRRAS